MKPYPRYKTSRVVWHGQLPDNWQELPIKRTGAVFNGGTPKSEMPEYWDGDVNWFTPKDIAEDGEKRLTESSRKITRAGLNNSNAALVRQNSLLITTRAPIGNLAIINTEYTMNQGCRSITPRPETSVDFLFYQLKVRKEQLNVFGAGTTFLEISTDTFKNFPVLLPPLPEQRAIAAYLDRETARIDNLIAKQEQLIALLEEKRQALISHAVTKGLDPNVKMKDTGVEWLGQVPEHWSTPPLYSRYSVELGKMLNESHITGAYLLPYLRNTDVQWGRINFSELPVMDIKPSEYRRYTIQVGDLLVCEGGEVGRAAIVEDLPITIGFQKALHRLRPIRADELSRFAYYTLIWAANTKVFNAGGMSTIAHLTAEKLRQYRFPKPPFDEQQAITANIEKYTKRHEILVARALSAIELLKEKRSALISAAVTGKIDVTQEGDGTVATTLDTGVRDQIPIEA